MLENGVDNSLGSSIIAQVKKVHNYLCDIGGIASPLPLTLPDHLLVLESRGRCGAWLNRQCFVHEQCIPLFLPDSVHDFEDYRFNMLQVSPLHTSLVLWDLGDKYVLLRCLVSLCDCRDIHGL